MSENGERRTFLGLTKPAFVACLLVYVILSTAFFTVTSIRRDQAVREAVHQAQATAAEGRQARLALCALRNNLDKNISDEQDALAKSRKFFKEHPNAFPGVPQSTIDQSFRDKEATIARQQGSLRALDRNIRCGTK